MSDAVTVPPTQSAGSEGPYAVRTINYGGYDYTFSFYKGFASQVQYTPAGTDKPILVYQQQGTFDCKDTGGPISESTLTIVGGPLNLDVQLDIDDGPFGPDFLGPIAGLEIGLKRRGSAVIPPKRVKPLKGGDQISRIVIRERGNGNGNGGGVHAFQDDDGGTVRVENTAQCCPPHC